MGLYTSLATVRVSLGRVHEILDVAPEVVEAATPVSLSTARGELALDDVSFSFERGAPVLEHVSLRVAPGECLAIVGPSGSGKSTIADLVLRLLDPQAGTVRLDGHDLRTLRLSDLRARVALVDQEPAVFHASIADNIRYARPAARSAGLDAFVATLPDGYDTTVGERGAAFSAGERQRVAVARALLADPAVLVLDEATAALDPRSEQRVVEGYETVMAGRTTILITHRASLAWRADRVVVIDGARVVEQGSPAELMTHGGLFAELFAGDGAQADRPSRPGPSAQSPTPDARRPTPETYDTQTRPGGGHRQRRQPGASACGRGGGRHGDPRPTGPAAVTTSTGWVTARRLPRQSASARRARSCSP